MQSDRYICFYSTSWRGGDGWYTNSIVQALADAIKSEQRSVIFVGSAMQPSDRAACADNLITRFAIGGSLANWSRIRKMYHSGFRLVQLFKELSIARCYTKSFVITFPHWLIVTLLQITLLRLSGARVVYIVHDPLPHAFSFPVGLRWLEKIIIKKTYLLSTRLITLTVAAKQALQQEFGILESKIGIIPHGVFDNGRRREIRSNKSFLIFGMLRSNKNILEALQAFKIVAARDPEIQLVIAGAPYNDEPEYWRICEKLIAELGSRVESEIGFVPEQRLPELFDSADAVLLPYRQFNSQSAVAVLAAVSQRPVIATDIGGIRELFAAGMCGVKIEQPAGTDEIVKAITAYREVSLAEWRAKAELSRAQLLDKLAWPRIGEALASELKLLDANDR